ncbi:hypothetical protein [Haloarcula litorea]|uniref:hypothetical protein n=1 Tax=Haloarcula litorea TaxID=3032579 RepID=UPI0023E88326|nr:hypothetical protein [Halomicroarcula sp. GDY20]
MDDSRNSVGRRRLLAALSTAAAGAFAGCPGSVGVTDSADETGPTPAPIPTTATDAALPPDLAAVPCPRFPGATVDGQRRCGPFGPDDGIALRTAERRPRLPAAALRFRFRNAGDAPLAGLSPPWSLQKYVDGRWHVLWPAQIRSGTDSAAAGGRERRTWELAIDNGATDRLDPRRDLDVTLTGDATRIPVAGLGGGRYAFVVAGWLGGIASERPVAVGARFLLDGPALDLPLTDDVERAVRNGATTLVESDPGLGERVTYVLEPATPGADAPTLLAEQAIRNPPLRNLLSAYSPGAAQVRLRTRRHPAFPPLPERAFSFRGAGFGVSVAGDEDE